MGIAQRLEPIAEHATHIAEEAISLYEAVDSRHSS